MLPAYEYKPEFLFVHATSGSRHYKYKDRHDIRSHVRKVASKRAKADIGQGPRNQVLAAGGLSQYLPKLSPHGRNNSSHVSVTSGQTSNRRHGILDSEVLETSEAGKRHLLCNVCEGQRMAGHHCHKSKVEEASKAMCRHLWRTSEPSPVGILGAGRQDPFSSLPIVNPKGKDHELIDHGK